MESLVFDIHERARHINRSIIAISQQYEFATNILWGSWKDFDSCSHEVKLRNLFRLEAFVVIKGELDE